MNIKQISQKKKREDCVLRLYDKDINNVIKKFSRVKGDGKYYYG